MVNTNNQSKGIEKNMALTKTNYDDEKRFSKENVSLSRDFPVKLACFNAY